MSLNFAGRCGGGSQNNWINITHRNACLCGCLRQLFQWSSVQVHHAAVDDFAVFPKPKRQVPRGVSAPTMHLIATRQILTIEEGGEALVVEDHLMSSARSKSAQSQSCCRLSCSMPLPESLTCWSPDEETIPVKVLT